MCCSPWSWIVPHFHPLRDPSCTKEQHVDSASLRWFFMVASFYPAVWGSRLLWFCAILCAQAVPLFHKDVFMVASYVQTVRQFGRDVRLYLFATALMGFTYDGGIYAVIFNLYLLRLEYGPAFVGQVNGVGMLAFAISAFPAGALGDRWGSRRLLLAGLVIMFGGSLLLALAEFVPRGLQPNWLIITYVIMNIGLSLYFVNSVPYLMNITAAAERNAAFSVQSALISLAAFAGSLIGGFLPGIFALTLGLSLDQAAPYRFPLLLASALFITGIWALLSTGPERTAVTAPGATPPLPVDAGPSIWRLITGLTFIRLLLVSGSAVAMTFFNVYMDAGLDVPTAQIGIAIAIGRLSAVPAALFTPILAARLGNAPVTLLASFAVAFFLIPMALVPAWYAATLGYVGAIAMTSIRYPAFMVYTMEIVPAKYRSVLAGTGEMAAGLSFATLAYTGGFIILWGGYAPLFLTGAALNLIGTGCLIGFFRLYRSRAAVASAPDRQSTLVYEGTTGEDRAR
jgi:MFS family permease